MYKYDNLSEREKQIYKAGYDVGYEQTKGVIKTMNEMALVIFILSGKQDSNEKSK